MHTARRSLRPICRIYSTDLRDAAAKNVIKSEKCYNDVNAACFILTLAQVIARFAFRRKKDLFIEFEK